MNKSSDELPHARTGQRQNEGVNGDSHLRDGRSCTTEVRHVLACGSSGERTDPEDVAQGSQVAGRA